MLEKALQQTKYLYPFQHKGNAMTLVLPENVFSKKTKPAWDHYTFRVHKFPAPERGEIMMFYKDTLTTESGGYTLIFPKFALVRSAEDSPTMRGALNWLEQNTFVPIELGTLLIGVTELKRFKTVFAEVNSAYFRGN